MVTIITDVRVPAESFPLGRVFQEHPDVAIELERLVPMREGVMPLFWVNAESAADVEETLRGDPLVEDIDQLTRASGRILYSVTWNPDVDELVRTFVDLGVDVLSAAGTADAWEFRLQFRNRGILEEFRRACQEHDVDLELVELYNPLMPPEKGPLTSEQHDALATAYENGYWDVPRETTMDDLAAFMGVSDAQLSRSLRESVRIAVGEHLSGPGGKPYE